MGLKRLRFFSLILLLLFVFFIMVSCSSTSKTGEFTDDEYAFTARLVLEKARDQAFLNLFRSLNGFKESMIPSSCSFIKEQSAQIPGMDRLIRQWSRSATSFILPLYERFTTYTAGLLSVLEIDSPRTLVKSGDTAISDYCRTNLREEMADAIAGNLYGLDFSLWNKISSQYEAWYASRKLVYSEDIPYLKPVFTEKETAELLSLHLADLFFSYLGKAEALIHTTPDPDMDETAAKILGLY